MTPFSDIVARHLSVIKALDGIQAEVQTASNLIIDTFKRGNKLLLCGNGGSAADSQHIAAEFMVRYEKYRRGLPAVALTTDTSILTAHPNDFEFDSVFARQVENLGQAGDCLIAISTSGNSANIINAVNAAQSANMQTIALTGNQGGKLKSLADCAVIVPSDVTARIQEAHILIAHWWCLRADEIFSKKSDSSSISDSQTPDK